MCIVGPLNTENASTHGMISATSTTHDTSSNRSRNHHARNVAAASFANDAAPPQPAAENATASAAQPAPTTQRPGARHKGSSSSTVANAAGMTRNESTAMSHHVVRFGSDACAAKYAASAAASATNATILARLSAPAGDALRT